MRPIGALPAVWLLTARTLRRFLRNPELVLGSFVVPVLMMFVMLPIFGNVLARSTGEPYISRLAPLTVLLTITFSMGTSASGYFDDIHSGVMQRLRTMPVSAASLLAGRVAGDLARILAIAAVTVLVGLAAGLRFEQGPLGVLGFFGVVAAYGCLFTMLALCVAAHASSEAAAQGALNIPAALLMFLSSGYVPITAFPDAVQPVVRLSPLTAGVEALIGLSRGGPVAGPVLGALAWTVGGTLILGALTMSRLAGRTRKT